MPIPNSIKITPTTESSGGQSPLIADGIYDAKVADISYISAEQNTFSGKPQLKFKFKILNGEYKDIDLTSWVSLTMNPGWEAGNPSHLYNITKAILREEPDLNADFYPNTLLGGVLRIFVETKTAKNGNQYSRVTKYLAPSMGATATRPVIRKPQEEEVPLPPEPQDEGTDEFGLTKSDKEFIDDSLNEPVPF